MKSVCVYCGSSPGSDPLYARAARDVGTLLAGSGLRLVYGGGSVGLMGEVANAALRAGGHVIGVIPRGLFRAEVAHPGVTELIEVTSMHERKMAMFDRSDAFVALPGGLGTLEELTELTTWAQLRLHSKPIATFDVNGFWQPFHQLIGHLVAAGFMKPANAGLIVNVESLDDLLPALKPPG